jgi:glycosyltransferase involved in cell wall biosynthesis
MCAATPLKLTDTPRALRESKGPAWPRVTIVTPVYNGEQYLEETITSILNQGYPNLEYIIVDDGSTDNTVEIIKKYEQHLAWWASQPNQGMYATLNRGFARSSGEIMGWLNANDKLHTDGLFVAGSVFRDLPDVEWITGRPTIFSEQGMTVIVKDVPRWSRYRFLAGANRTIQQESTFWRRSLWDKAGGYVDDSGKFGNVSDFELWVRFFRHAQVYPVDALIGGWRAHSDSGSSQDMEKYYRIHDEIVEAELGRTPWGRMLRLFRQISKTLKPIPIVRGIWRRVVMNSLYGLPGPDWPPVIEYQWDKWGMRQK